MKIVLLAGGLGTRLREEAEVRPKPMVEVGRKPLPWDVDIPAFLAFHESHGRLATVTTVRPPAVLA
jgi:NDP-sugar pyrophosphorylase family protein